MLRTLRHLSRTPRVLYALWLAFVLAQPAGMHACPVHDRMPAAVMNGHAVSGAPSHEAAHDTHRDHGAPQCHCLGACCVAHAAALAATASRVPAPAHIVAAPTFKPSAEQSFDEAQHLLPPATAPPTYRLA